LPKKTLCGCGSPASRQAVLLLLPEKKKKEVEAKEKKTCQRPTSTGGSL
jgi:hypothetical protein